MNTDEAVQALIVASSDERDLQLQLRLEAWRDGWRACQQAQGDAYERGYTAAQADYKAIQHGAVRGLRQHLATWDGLREYFGDPRPGDIQPARREGAA